MSGNHLTRTPFAPIDITWLNMAFLPGNTMVGGLAILDEPLTMAALHENLNDIKRTPETWVSLGILQGLGLVPGRVERAGVRFFGVKGTAAMTNVCGPSHPRYLTGRRLIRVPER